MHLFSSFFLVSRQVIIMLTCPCQVQLYTFYIVKLGFTGVYIISYFARKHRLWVLTINVLSKNK